MVNRLKHNHVIFLLVLDKLNVENRADIRVLNKQEQFIENFFGRGADAQRAVFPQRSQSQDSVGLQKRILNREPEFVDP